MNKTALLTLALLIALACKKSETQPHSSGLPALTTSFLVNGSPASYASASLNELYITCPNDTATNQITYAHTIINYDAYYPTRYYDLSIPYDSSKFITLVKTNTNYPVLNNVGDSCSIGMDFSYNDGKGISYTSINDSNLTQQYMLFTKILYAGDEEYSSTNYAVYYLTGSFACTVKAGDTSLPMQAISNGNFTAKAYLRKQ